MKVIDISHANNLYKSGKYAEFLEYCHSFDEIEDNNTLHQIGSCYAKSKGVEKNVLKAEELFLKAAKKGHINSIISLAILYSDEEEVRDINKSIEWYEIGAKKGSAASMFNLAWVYQNIDCVKDISKAIYWYRLAADNKHKRGKYLFAKLSLNNKLSENEDIAYQYLFECSVDDMDKSFDLLTKNAESGSRVAQFYLGRYYTEKTDVDGSEQTAFEWYKKSAMQGYVPAQNIILINQSENTNQTVKEIKTDTSVIVETTADNSRKLDAITNSLMSMNEKIANIRATSFTGNAATEDNEIGSALEKSAAVINSTVKESPADKLNKEAEHLIYLFGKQTWERLLPETQQSLISSAYLLKECEGMPPDFDYSGICITAVVALEKELKRVFSDNYIKYLNDAGIDLPNLFKEKNYFFSLGKMATLFGYDVENNEIRYNYYAKQMEKYLKTIVKKVFSYDPLLAFIENDPNCFVFRCLTVNKTYRCKAAHCGNVSYDDAVDCCYEVYGEASAHIDAKRQSAEIISLLRDLFSKLK